MENVRQQLLLERVLEDEALRGNLDQRAVQVLLRWVGDQVTEAAADRELPDETVEKAVSEIRQAASAAARTGENNHTLLIEMAERRLQRLRLLAHRPPEPAPVVNDDAVHPNVADDDSQANDDLAAISDDMIEWDVPTSDDLRLWDEHEAAETPAEADTAQADQDLLAELLLGRLPPKASNNETDNNQP
jgi:hypothetical protein